MAVTCPCCHRTASTIGHLTIINAHREEDKRLNHVVALVVELIAYEQKQQYPKPLPSRFEAIKRALEDFTKVETDLAEQNYVVQNLITIERELER